LSELTGRAPGNSQSKGVKVQSFGTIRNTILISRALVFTFVVLTFFVFLYFTYIKQNNFYHDQLDENKLNHIEVISFHLSDYSSYRV